MSTKLDEIGIVGSLSYEAEHTADPQRLAQLAKSEYTQVRVDVAANPHATEEVLDSLVGDSNNKVRMTVASNPNATPAILEQLSRDHAPEVIDTAEQILYQRCKEFKPVPQAWKRTEDRMREASKYAVTDKSDAAKKAQYNLVVEETAKAQHHDALMISNQNLINMFAQNASTGTRWLLCHNRNISAGTLNHLMRDPEPLVRLAATRATYALKIAAIRAHAREHPVSGAEQYAIADGWTQWQHDVKDPEGTLKELQHTLGINEPNVKQAKGMAR